MRRGRSHSVSVWIAQLLLLAVGNGAHAEQSAPQPLSFRLELSGTVSGSALTPEKVLDNIVQSLPGYFTRSAANTADVHIAYMPKLQADQSQHWDVRLTSPFDARGLQSSFASLEASEVELKLELQRLYIIKNLASIDLHDAEITLAVDGDPKSVYVTGDAFRVVFQSSIEGYLNLINVRPDGQMCLLLPLDRAPLKVSAGVPLYLPASGVIKVDDKGPYGTDYLKAIFSTVIIDLSFLRCGEAVAKPSVEELLAKAQAMTVKARGIGAGQNRIATAELRIETSDDTP